MNPIIIIPISEQGDFLVDVDFMSLVDLTLDHLNSRPNADGNIFKLLTGTFNVVSLLKIFWVLDETLDFTHYAHHKNMGMKFVKLLKILLSSKVIRIEYDETICNILKSMRLNCSQNTTLKDQYLSAGILEILEKNIVNLKRNNHAAFFAIYITIMIGNPEEIADYIQNSANLKVIADICDACLKNFDFKVHDELYGIVTFKEVLEILSAFEKDEGFQLVTDSPIVESLMSALQMTTISKAEFREVIDILFGLAVVEICLQRLCERKLFEVCEKILREISDPYAEKRLEAILCQFKVWNMDLQFPSAKKIVRVYVCLADKDKNFSVRFVDNLKIGGFRLVLEENIHNMEQPLPENGTKEPGETAQENHFFQHFLSKGFPSWMACISASHMVVAGMSKNLELDKFCRIKLQYAKNFDKEIRFVDIDKDYNPKNWLFDASQKCLLHDNVTNIKHDAVLDTLNQKIESEKKSKFNELG